MKPIKAKYNIIKGVSMRKLVAIAVILVVLCLTGCESPTGAPGGWAGSTRHFYTDKGVECVWVKSGYGGGLSCNWEKYNKENGL